MGAIPLLHVLTLPRLCQTAARAGPEAGSATTAQGKPCRARREPREAERGETGQECVAGPTRPGLVALCLADAGLA